VCNALVQHRSNGLWSQPIAHRNELDEASISEWDVWDRYIGKWYVNAQLRLSSDFVYKLLSRDFSILNYSSAYKIK